MGHGPSLDSALAGIALRELATTVTWRDTMNYAAAQAFHAAEHGADMFREHGRASFITCGQAEHYVGARAVGQDRRDIAPDDEVPPGR